MTDNLVPTRKIRLPVELMLFLFPVFPMFWPDGSSAVYSLAILVGIFFLLSGKTRSQIGRNQKLVFFACAFFFFSALLSIKANRISDDTVARLGLYAHFLFVIPLYYLWAAIKPKQEFFWFGLAAGAIVACVIAVIDIIVSGQGRATGAQHPIVFGGLSLAMGTMAFFGLSILQGKRKWTKAIFYFALLCGIGASILSGSRGTWIALPALLILIGWHTYKIFGRTAILALFVTVVVALGASYLANKQSIDSRISLAVSEIKTYQPGGKGSVKDRFEMWRGAWKIFVENPIRGAGVGAYKNEFGKLVASKKFDKRHLNYNEPHNDYLAALSEKGLIGFTALLMVYLVPLSLFLSLVRAEGGNSFAMAGIAFILLFMHLSLTSTLFNGTLTTVFYTFYLSVLTYFSLDTTNKKGRENCRRQHRITVTVIAKNEADRIEPCLSSVADWADEIVVLDSGSEDNTVEIAKRFTQKVVCTDWPGFAKQKQRALDMATSDWVLSLDADEVMTEELKQEIDRILSSAPKLDGYHFPRHLILAGKRLDFAGRDHPLRLFRKSVSRFSESKVHERIIVATGKIGTTKSILLHNAYRSPAHMVEKLDQYASLWSEQERTRSRSVNSLSAISHASWAFLAEFILRLGILDGWRGFKYVAAQTGYTFRKYAMLRKSYVDT